MDYDDYIYDLEKREAARLDGEEWDREVQAYVNEHGDLPPDHPLMQTNDHSDHEQLVEWTEEIYKRGGVRVVIRQLADVVTKYYGGAKPFWNDILQHEQQYPDMLAASFVNRGYIHVSNTLIPSDCLQVLLAYRDRIKELPTAQTIEDERETDVNL